MASGYCVEGDSIAPSEMTEVLLFHHALGLTPGCRSLADRLRAAGHQVHTPDLFEGEVFTELSAGVAHAEAVGFGEILERGRQAAQSVPAQTVYVGVSLGVLPAQMLAQTRPGARGAVLVSGAISPSEFGGAWPRGVRLQMHMMDADVVVVQDGDLEVARTLADTVEDAQIYLYAGDQHLFIDESVADYDQPAAALLTDRTIGFLDALS
jgi:dienelactone hydrolase